MARKEIRIAAISAGLLLLSLATLELAFRAREWRERSLRGNTPSAKTILLIGDSVLGVGSDSPVTRYVSAAWPTGEPAPRFVNLSRPSNTSERVSLELDGYLDTYHPEGVVLLLGRSDWSGKKTRRWPRWLSELRVVQFARVAGDQLTYLRDRASLALSSSRSIDHLADDALRMKIAFFQGKPAVADGVSDSYLGCFAIALKSNFDRKLLPRAEACLKESAAAPPAFLSHLKLTIGQAYAQTGEGKRSQQLYFEALADDPENVRAQSALGFSFYSHSDFANAIPPLERALSASHSSDESARCVALYLAYLRSHELRRGEEFFSHLVATPGHPRCADYTLPGIRGAREGYGSYRETITSYKDRGDIMRKLFYLRVRYESEPDTRASIAARARPLFELYERFSSAPHSLDHEVFDGILARLTARGIKTLVMQYPDEPESELRAFVTGLGSNFDFIGTRSLLFSAAPETPVFDLLADDNYHFSDLGARTVAPVLARRLAGMLQR